MTRQDADCDHPESECRFYISPDSGLRGHCLACGDDWSEPDDIPVGVEPDDWDDLPNRWGSPI